jgi:hypothetical protein
MPKPGTKARKRTLLPPSGSSPPWFSRSDSSQMRGSFRGSLGSRSAPFKRSTLVAFKALTRKNVQLRTLLNQASRSLGAEGRRFKSCHPDARLRYLTSKNAEAAQQGVASASQRLIDPVQTAASRPLEPSSSGSSLVGFAA